MEKIKRSEFAAFLNTTPSDTTATWVRMGKGIVSQSIAYNPNVTTETYIDEDNATNSVDSYAPAIDGTQTCYKDEPVFEYIDALRKARATGADLETEICLVNIYDATTSSSTVTYSAEKNKAIIQLGDFGGEGGGNVQITYTIALNGDPVLGTATITEGALTFTPAS